MKSGIYVGCTCKYSISTLCDWKCNIYNYGKTTKMELFTSTSITRVTMKNRNGIVIFVESGPLHFGKNVSKKMKSGIQLNFTYKYSMWLEM